MLSGLGHRVVIESDLPAGSFDLVVALHARRSAEAVRASRRLHPGRPIVVALTGTDLYRDIHEHAGARRSLALADRLVVLHPAASRALPRAFRDKARFIPQSAPPVAQARPRPRACFQIAVVGHLRDEKDPLRAALAARMLPPESRVRVVHAGAALDASWARAARAEERVNPRYRWLGEVSPRRARGWIASSHLMALTSRLEGGANVLGEALAAGTPIVASRIDCTAAILGADYPGLFDVGATRQLADLVLRAEREPAFLRELARGCRQARPMLSPGRERAAWRSLLQEFASGSGSRVSARGR